MGQTFSSDSGKATVGVVLGQSDEDGEVKTSGKELFGYFLNKSHSNRVASLNLEKMRFK